MSQLNSINCYTEKAAYKGGFFILFKEVNLKHRSRHLYVLLILISVFVLYMPGLSGVFLLDDYGTIASLGNWGSIDSWHKWQEYVTTAYAGPNGRVIAVATFTLNGSTWPASPYWFLFTNIFIHVINTSLLFVFLRKLFSLANVEKGFYLALIACAIWALHSMQVSTVLYVVQRMAQLELTFNLLAICFYLSARSALSSLNYNKGIGWFAACLVSAVMALYCKETAILIPLQLLLIELLLRYTKTQCNWPNSCWPFFVVYAPVFVLFALMFYKFVSYFDSTLLMERRGFTLEQRLLTQLRVMGDYLTYFFVPPIQTAGVFHDGYSLSTSFTKPISTFYWFVIHFSLVLGAFFSWRRWPIIAFGVLWFYGNHLIESVVVQLELKYEHRNYLPSIGLAVAVAYVLVSLPTSHFIKKGVITILILALSGVTYARASLWGDPDKAVLVWMEKNPASTRALETAILHYSQKPGNPAIVNQLLKVGINRDSEDPVILLKALSYDCDLLANQYSPIDIVNLLSKSEIHWQMSALLEGVLSSISSGRCDLVSKSDFQAMLSAVKENPAFRKTRIRWGLENLKSKSEFLLGDKSLAIKHYRDLKWREGMLGMRMNQALFLANNNYQKAAADILETAIVNAGREDQRLIEPAKDMLNRIMKDVKNDQ